MDLKELNVDDLKTLADNIEFKYHPNIGEDTLREKLEVYIEEHPECIPSEENGDESTVDETLAALQKNKPEDKPEESEESIEDLKKRILDLENENLTLKSKGSKPTAIKQADKTVRIQSTLVIGDTIETSHGSVEFDEKGYGMATPEAAAKLETLDQYKRVK